MFAKVETGLCARKVSQVFVNYCCLVLSLITASCDTLFTFTSNGLRVSKVFVNYCSCLVLSLITASCDTLFTFTSNGLFFEMF